MGKRILSIGLCVAILATQCVFAHQPSVSVWESRRLSRVPSAAFSARAPIPPPPVAAPAHFDDRLAALIPPSVARLKPRGKSAGPAIILIQDVHRNAEAQRNISRAVAALSEAGVLSAVALEGAFGPVAVDALRSGAAPDARARVADHLLARHEISGPVHAALTARVAVPLLGADDAALHAANAEAYRSSRPLARAALERVDRAAAEASSRKPSTFAPALLRFDAAAEAYHAGRATLVGHARLVAPHLPGSAAIRSFLRASDLETSLDAAAVEAERRRLIERLVPRLDAAAARDIAAWAASFRLGVLDAGEFHRRLLARARAAGISGSFPALESFLAYAQAVDGIDGDALMADLFIAEDNGYRALAATADEARLAARSRLALLSRKLINCSLTAGEWDLYRRLRNDAVASTDLGAFERFYIEASRRDDVLADRALSAARRSPGAVALVAGGFHAGGVTRRLEAAGSRVIVVTPAVTTLDGDGAAYLSAFTRGKTPIEKLFDGEKLFLAQNPALGLRQAPALVVGVEEARDPSRALGEPAALYAALGGEGTLLSSADNAGGAVVRIAVGDQAADLSIAASRSTDGGAPVIRDSSSRAVAASTLDSIRSAYDRWARANGVLLRRISAVGEVLAFFTTPFVLLPVIGPAGVMAALILFSALHPVSRLLLTGERESFRTIAVRSAFIAVAATAFAGLSVGVEAAGLPFGDAAATALLSAAHAAYIAAAPALGLPHLMVMPPSDPMSVEEFERLHPHARSLPYFLVERHASDLHRMATGFGDDEFLFESAFPAFIRRWGRPWVLENWERLNTLQEANPPMFGYMIGDGLIDTRRIASDWAGRNWPYIVTAAREFARPDIILKVVSAYQLHLRESTPLAMMRDVGRILERSTEPWELAESLIKIEKDLRKLEWRQIVDMLLATPDTDEVARRGIPKLFKWLRAAWVVENWNNIVTVARVADRDAGLVLDQGLAPVLAASGSRPVDWDLMRRLTKADVLPGLGTWVGIVGAANFEGDWDQWIRIGEDPSFSFLLYEATTDILNAGEGRWWRDHYPSYRLHLFRLLWGVKPDQRERRLRPVFRKEVIQTIQAFPHPATAFRAYADAVEDRSNVSLKKLVDLHAAGEATLETPRYGSESSDPNVRWLEEHVAPQEMAAILGLGSNVDRVAVRGRLIETLQSGGRLDVAVRLGRLVGGPHLADAWVRLRLNERPNHHLRTLADRLEELAKSGDTAWPRIGDALVRLASENDWDLVEALGQFVEFARYRRLDRTVGGMAGYLDDYSRAHVERWWMSEQDFRAVNRHVRLPNPDSESTVAASREEFDRKVADFPPRSRALSDHWEDIERMLDGLPPTLADQLIDTELPRLVRLMGEEWVEANWDKVMALHDANHDRFPLVIQRALPKIAKIDGIDLARDWDQVVEAVRESGQLCWAVFDAVYALRRDITPDNLASTARRLASVALRQERPADFLRRHVGAARREAPPNGALDDIVQMAEAAGERAATLFENDIPTFEGRGFRAILRRHWPLFVQAAVDGADLAAISRDLRWIEDQSRFLSAAEVMRELAGGAGPSAVLPLVSIGRLTGAPSWDARHRYLLGLAADLDRIGLIERSLTAVAAALGAQSLDASYLASVLSLHRRLPRRARPAAFTDAFDPAFLASAVAAGVSLPELIAGWTLLAKEPDRLTDLIAHQRAGEYSYVPPAAPAPVADEGPAEEVEPETPAPRREPVRIAERERVNGAAIGRTQEAALRASLQEVFNRPRWDNKVRELSPDSGHYKMLDPEIVLWGAGIRLFVVDGLDAHVKKRAAQAEGRLPNAITTHPGTVVTVESQSWILIDAEDFRRLTDAREATRLAWSRHMAWHAAHPDGPENENPNPSPRLPDLVVRPAEPTERQIVAAVGRGRDELLADLPNLTGRRRQAALLALDRLLWPAVEQNLRHEFLAARFLVEEVWRARLPLEWDDVRSIARAAHQAEIGAYNGEAVSSFVYRAGISAVKAGAAAVAEAAGVPGNQFRASVSAARAAVRQFARGLKPRRVSAASVRDALGSGPNEAADLARASARPSLDDPRQPAARARRGAVALDPAAEIADLRDRLVSVVRHILSERSAAFVLAYTGLDGGAGMTGGDLARQNSMTPANAYQILGKAFTRLRDALGLEMFEVYLDMMDVDAPPPLEAGVREFPTRLDPPRRGPISFAEEDELIEFAAQALTRRQRDILPAVAAVMLGARPDAALAASAEAAAVAGEMCEWFTFGVLRRYGSDPVVARTLAVLMSETPVQRSFRRENMTALLDVMGGDHEGLKELILQLHPGEFKEADIDALIQGHFSEIAARVTRRPREAPAAGEVLETVRRMVTNLAADRALRRRLVLKRFLRATYYPVMRRDEETGSTAGFTALRSEIAAAEEGSLWRGLLSETLDFYTRARAFQPRGFREEPEPGIREPLIPAQRYGIWQALQSLENPAERSALFTSEPRVGKTIMAILAALNIRKPEADGGGFAVNRILFTSPNASKFEAAAEFSRRVDPALGFEVLVLDGPRERDRAEIERVRASGRPAAIFANYEAVRDLPDELAAFAPDAHIIDELENLRHGDDTVRAPIIFGIPAAYRIGITARFIVKGGEDAAAALHWLRPGAFPDARAAALLTDDEIFSAKDPIEVRWRRRVVLPEIGEPRVVTELVPYGPEQQRVVRAMRADLPGFLGARAREEHRGKVDHVFTRIQLEQMASIDPAIVAADVDEMPPKLARMLEIIEAERARGGKIVVLVDFREGVDRVVDLINRRLGSETAAAATTGVVDVPLDVRNRRIEDFRSHAEPVVLVGTSFMLGSSLNLFQRRGTPFHISTMIRLSRPARNIDAGERLIGIGQTHPVVVYNLVSRFATGAGETVEQMYEQMLAGEQQVFEHIVDGRPLIDEESARRLDSLAARMEAAVQAARAEEAGDSPAAVAPPTPSSLPYLIFLARTLERPTVAQKILIGLGGASLEAAVLAGLGIAAILLPGTFLDLLFAVTVLVDLMAHVFLDKAIANPHAARSPPVLHAVVLLGYIAASPFIPWSPWIMAVPAAVHLISDALRLFWPGFALYDNPAAQRNRPRYPVRLTGPVDRGDATEWISELSGGRVYRFETLTAPADLPPPERRRALDLLDQFNIRPTDYDRSFLADHVHGVVLRAGGRLAGFYIADRRSGNLHALAVSPEFRGTGAVDALLEDFVRRILGGDRSRTFSAEIVRAHGRVRPTRTTFTMAQFRTALGVNSDLTLSRSYGVRLRGPSFGDGRATWEARRDDGIATSFDIRPVSNLLPEADRKRMERLMLDLSKVSFGFDETFLEDGTISAVAHAGDRLAGFYIYDVRGNRLVATVVTPEFRGTGAVDALLEDFVVRCLHGDRNTRFFATVLREHERASRGDFWGTLDELRVKLGVRSVLTLERLAGEGEPEPAARPDRAAPATIDDRLTAIERFTEPAVEDGGRPHDEFMDEVWRRLGGFYDALLGVAAVGGVFDGSIAILPAAGADAFPALHVPTLAIDRTDTHAGALAVVERATGRPRAEFESRFIFRREWADLPGAYELQFGPVLAPFARRVVIFKSISGYMVPEEGELRRYLFELDRFLRPGDRVLVLDAGDDARTRGWFADNGYAESRAGLSDAEWGRLQSSVDRVRDDRRIRSQRMTLGDPQSRSYFEVPTAFRIYEKPAASGDTAPRADAEGTAAGRPAPGAGPADIARLYADVVRSAAEGRASGADIASLADGGRLSMDLARLGRFGLSFADLTPADLAVFRTEFLRAFGDGVDGLTPELALESALSTAAALEGPVEPGSALGDRNVFLPAGDDGAAALVDRTLASLGSGRRMVVAVNTEAARRDIENRVRGDRRVSVISSEAAGAAPVMRDLEIDLDAAEELLARAGVNDRSGWIAVRPEGVTFRGSNAALALLRLELAWYILGRDGLGAVLTRPAIESAVRVARLALQSA